MKPNFILLYVLIKSGRELISGGLVCGFRSADFHHFHSQIFNIAIAQRSILNHGIIS